MSSSTKTRPCAGEKESRKVMKLLGLNGQNSEAQLMSAMREKMGDQDSEPLPQENMDGCDSDEWSD